MIPSQPRPALLFARALRLFCPHCGAGRMFRSWFTMRDRCEACDFVFERGEHDYFIGAYMLALVLAELIVVAIMIAVIMLRWPDVPWNFVLWGTAGLSVPAIVFMYPFSRSLWLAIDLTFRPAERTDFAAEEESPGYVGGGAGS